VSKAGRFIPARVFFRWWQHLHELKQQDAAHEAPADIGEAGDLLSHLEDIGHANGAVHHWRRVRERRALKRTGDGAGSTASFTSTLNQDFDWKHGEVNFAPDHPYGSFDPEPLIAAIVQVTGIPETG
jgi:hypothetical protein